MLLADIMFDNEHPAGAFAYVPVNVDVDCGTSAVSMPYTASSFVICVGAHPTVQGSGFRVQGSGCTTKMICCPVERVHSNHDMLLCLQRTLQT